MFIKIRKAMAPSGGLALAAFFSLVLSGCFARYGVVHPSSEIDKLFESGKVLPDHRYYVDGSDVRPNAILAVDNHYRLESALWRPVDLNPAQLRAWVDEMTRYRGYSLYTYGAKMVGPDGRQFGFWYSPYPSTTVQVMDGNVVSVLTPDTSANARRPFGFFAP